MPRRNNPQGSSSLHQLQNENVELKAKILKLKTLVRRKNLEIQGYKSIQGQTQDLLRRLTELHTLEDNLPSSSATNADGARTRNRAGRSQPRDGTPQQFHTRNAPQARSHSPVPSTSRSAAKAARQNAGRIDENDDVPHDSTPAGHQSGGAATTQRKKHGKRGPNSKKCLCGLSFPTKTALQRHLNEKIKGTFVCDYPGCEERFVEKVDIKRHRILKHNGYRIWPCGKCKGFFATEDKMKEHQKRAKCFDRRIKTGQGYDSIRDVDHTNEWNLNEEELQQDDDDEI